MNDTEVIEVEAYCKSCGDQLNVFIEWSNLGVIKVTVAPCENCLDNTKDAGLSEGYSDGYDVGYDKGYKAGVADERE